MKLLRRLQKSVVRFLFRQKFKAFFLGAVKGPLILVFGLIIVFKSGLKIFFCLLRFFQIAKIVLSVVRESLRGFYPVVPIVNKPSGLGLFV